MAIQVDMMKKVPVREQDPKVRATNFEEVCLGYNKEEAEAEATRCLNCKNPQCVQGCPVSINIPGFISQLKEGNVKGAYEIISESSALPAVCGRVCPQERQCEAKCIRGIKGEAVSIGKLERYTADTAKELGIRPENHSVPNGKKVAVIGAGPSGLTCAGDLAKLGYEVRIFEALHKAGGVLVYGIPEFRLPKERVVAKEIENVEALGVTIETDCVVGHSTTVQDLMDKEGFDAVFIGSGAGLPRFMHIPGEQALGVFSANEFLTRSNLMGAYSEESRTPIMRPKKCVVVGGGNVAMDAARTAIRLGADVTVLYRKTQEEMPAIKSEYEDAVKEGVKFEWKTTVEAFLKGKNGRLGSCVLNTPEGERVEKFDRIYLAIGSRPANRIVSTTAGIEVDEKGYVKVVERPFGMTTRRGVFAGGDVVHRPQTVVLAMKAAKEVAQGIAQYVDAIKLLEEAKRIEKNGITDVE